MNPSDFIEQLLNDAIPTIPWISTSFQTDFILLSEFSELEGPKPLLTIPHTPLTKFNLNAFAVRIMSADCISIMQTTEFSQFNIAGDIQVVLTELTEGAVAYVHHFVLYDICARGFVRPFCLAYITHNYNELMTIFDQILQYFSTVSLLLHFGNAINFIDDITLRLKYLHQLVDIVTHETFDIYVDDKPLTDSQKKCITSDTLHELIKQLSELKEIFIQYILKGTFSEHQKIFHAKFQKVIYLYKQSQKEEQLFQEQTNVKEKCDCQEKQLEEGDRGNKSEGEESDVHLLLQNSDGPQDIPSCNIPADVISSILGNKIYKTLRSLNQLCDVTFNVGFDILKYALYNLQNNTKPFTPFIQLQSENDREIGTEEETNCTLSFCGVDFPVLTIYPTSNEDHCCARIRHEELSLNALPIQLFLKTSDLSLKTNQGKKISIYKNPINDSTNSFLSFLQFTSLSSPVHQQLPSYPASPTSSSSPHLPYTFKESKDGFIILDDPTLQKDDKQSNGSNDSFKDALAIPYSLSLHSINSSTTSSPDPIPFSRSVSTVSSDDGLSSSLISFIKCDKVSLLSLRRNFSFLPHMIYSLFLRRPVIIMAEEKQRKRVKKLIYCLINFVAQSKASEKKVVMWWTNVLQIKDLQKLSLLGISKSIKSNPVPLALRPYVTLFDYENQTLSGPSYVGHYLNDMFDTTRSFPSDQAYRKYIVQKFTELLSITYVHFAAMYMQSGKFNIGGMSQQKIYSSVLRTHQSLSKCDSNIIRELTNHLKEFVMETGNHYFDGYRNSDNVIKLNLLKCSVMVNKSKRKK